MADNGLEATYTTHFSYRSSPKYAFLEIPGLIFETSLFTRRSNRFNLSPAPAADGLVRRELDLLGAFGAVRAPRTQRPLSPRVPHLLARLEMIYIFSLKDFFF